MDKRRANEARIETRITGGEIKLPRIFRGRASSRRNEEKNVAKVRELNFLRN